MKTNLFLVLALSLFLTFPLPAEEAPKKEGVQKENVDDYSLLAESNRGKNRLGFYASLQSDPYPSKVGLNMAYNLSDLSRFHIGFGVINEPRRDVAVFGWGFNVFVPQWSTSPTIGISYSSVLGNGNFGGVSDHLYVNFGLDSQLDNGFYVGVGFNHSLTESSLRTRPFIHMGHFFKP